MRPITRLTIALIATLLAGSAPAQTPVAALLKPPAGAKHFIILSTGGKHGDSWAWRAADGTRLSRESLNLRGQVWEIDASLAAGPGGTPTKVTVRGVTPNGDAAERFTTDGGVPKWQSPVDAGQAPAGAAGFYAPFGGTIDLTAAILETLVANPGQAIDLLPGGRVSAERLTTLDVGEGAAKQTITAWSLLGVGTAPIPLWVDAKGKFFGATFGIAWLPAGYEGSLPAIEAAQSDALAAQLATLSKALPRTPKGAVAFTDVRLFDAEARRFVADQTVVIDGGKIVRVGPAAGFTPPAGAELIDGRGKTLLPGLWDAHMHVGGDYTGLQELSLGVTSVRDPGNSNARTLNRRARVASGELLFPNVYASSLIDGKGVNTAQVATAVGSPGEALAAIRQAKADGFIGVKFYGTLDPKWLPAAVAEAHRLGLHVHGHVPAGIRPMDAFAAGYDELTHINWVVMQAMPDDVIKVSNGIQRFEGPGRHARHIDLAAEPMRSLIVTMASKQIVSDPTMTAFESLYVPENGDLSPSYAAFVGTMPPTTERGFRQGGFAVPKDLTRADYRASWAKMVAALGAMHKAGVPIVAGTDGSGLELVRELEIYVEAGMTPAEALATATINAARLVKADRTTGSITVGKTADLVLVEGDPSARIADLRQTRVVVLGGRLMDADALRQAAGFSGRPK